MQVNVISEVDDYIPDVTYPSFLLHTCHHLQHLEIQDDERVKDVVFDMDSPGSRHFTTIQPPLQLPYLQSIRLSGLKEVSHVWKCNRNKFIIPQHQPSQFPFQNLMYIYLNKCHKIRHLFSPLMAKYLSNLKRLGIHESDGMEEVISRRDDEIEENTSTSYHQDTVFFPHLESIELVSLPCLKSVDGDTRCRSDNFSSNTFHDGFQVWHSDFLTLSFIIPLAPYKLNAFI
ncbi:putative leucine-rich repeat domain superfamily [Helianthus debilis subsp. tardiflorus]